MRRPGGTLDVLVLGAGISGLTAACHAALRGLSVGLVEAEPLEGGLVVNVGRIDGYPSPAPASGAQLAAALLAELASLGVAPIRASVTGLDVGAGTLRAVTSAGTLAARSVVCALGAALAPLEVPGAARLWQHGVSQCAFCDAGLYRDATVVVVGGGDAALQEALHLTGYAAEVILVHRRARLRARRHYALQAADSPRMRFRWSSEVAEVLGEEAVEAVRVRRVDGGGEDVVACRAVFPFVGLVPNGAVLPAAIERDPQGRVVVDRALMTRVPGVYAVGALRAGYGGLLTNAVSDGSLVAQSIVRAMK